MPALTFLLAFFRVAPPVTRPLLAFLWLTAGAGCLAVAAGASRVETALTPVLVLQIFAASSGFRSAARRGFYDLALSRGISPVRLLVGHWIASIAPGVAAWLAIALVDRIVAPGARAMTSGSLLALTLASTIPWGITSGLPRFAAGIGWLVILVTSLAIVPSGQLELMAAARAPHPSALGAVAVIVYPIALLGIDVGHLPIATVAPGLSCALLSMVMAIGIHGRAQIPLESGA
jgi:hypothetical protein